MVLTIRDLGADGGIVHAFSTVRQGSVARRSPGWESARGALLAEAGLAGLPVVTIGAVHGADVALVDHPQDLVPDVDGLVTALPGTVLFATFADCYPVILYDPARGAAGLGHAGWRGTAAGLAGALVRAMSEHFGCRPEDLVGGIGPGICGRCYEVGDEVAERFGPEVLAPSPAGRHLLDLARANRDQLAGAGLRPGRVHVSGVCTYESAHLPSHRRAADGTRFGGAVALRP